MNDQRINKVSAIAPVVMSLLALAMVLVVVTTGWQRDVKDEGTAAHLFQLLIVMQVPFILTFVTTGKLGADWASPKAIGFSDRRCRTRFGFIFQTVTVPKPKGGLMPFWALC